MRYTIISFAITVVMCCTSRSQEESQKKERTAYDVNFQNVLDSFCLLDHQLDGLSLADANTLFFLKSGRWDTSFLLILRRDTASIKAVYQEITPYNDEAAYKTDINFNIGFSFDADQRFSNGIINDSLWSIIVSNAQPLLDTVYHQWSLDVDGTNYLLSHGSKFTVNKPSKNGLALEKFGHLLRKALIHPAYRRKKEFDSSFN